MAKLKASVTQTVVRDSKSGRLVTVRGAGSLKGKLKIDKAIDLTKPIASQATNADRRMTASAPTKP
ncbi:hypothetical protein ACFQ1E_00605 [Sphingomonas canadensis]|uniref:Uncharacterized protein n=1 Tax=Sphingomonas canadensis TaxID=1219257 RepID=A0ABW3H295_9SPHN|nr:hypothetical protein [Sphingomonas canadensis]MCW3835260.1 hypothetical protein [Sphingomonas canadensis]